LQSLKHLIQLFSLLILLVLVNSCRKSEQFLQGSGTLNFSKDTVYFDTVFTKLPGSAYPRSINKQFMIRNPYKESVRVNIRLVEGSNSSFRLNVDGRPGKFIPNVEILPKDSAWVFVEATLEPNNQLNPALVRDQIEFETNGNKQYVALAAYGWDAYYLKDTVFSNNASLVLFDKPYVIVNTVFVDKNATLTIGKNTHFYCTPNSTINTQPGQLVNVSALNVFGTLKITGTKDEPVIFEGDRLDNSYKDKDGQWRGIHFWRGSTNNEINHALIKNASIGLWVDSLPESGTFNLVLKNSIIKNMSAYGVLGLTAKLSLENVVIANCGINTFLGYYGGDYSINHCSFYTSSNGRREPHVLFNNALRDENNVVIRNYDIRFDINNSIIWGPSGIETELGFDFPTLPPQNQTLLNYSIYKSKNDYGGASNKRNTDPKFENPNLSDLRIKVDSPAKDAGNPLNSLPTDINDKSRDVSAPDMGAFEL
jgi:hypothetical protein